MAERIGLALAEVGYNERHNHLDSIEFTGFSHLNRLWFSRHKIESEGWVKDAISSIGLPVDNINSVRYTNNTSESSTTLGSFGVNGKNEGEYRLYKLIREIPPIAQVGTMAHELAHANSPFKVENDTVYGSGEAREQASEHAKKVAVQTIATRVFLNPYHKHQYERLVKAQGKFAQSPRTENDTMALDRAKWLFAEETHAIMVQLRFENPEHLAQVEKAQHAALDRKRNTGAKVQGHVNIVEGVNKTLIALISEVDDEESLNSHIYDVRARFAQAA